ncbi:hypothetical protein H8S45_14735 [Agathobaculum sp. NSJ-28]|uniref:DNA polymerase III subunit beta n=2 Tax=Agathobaculum TaxID=2048137 RepID=A0A923RX74_9FIRM|nr:MULTISPECIES: hypothetical protein [Butyricicoccaceae]MBC5726704.1 hypothetical protein [Agathobaculum faecis]MCU6789797.1 hypothetical protein [Agathobaculum ammoniilyticum]WOC75668.1 hypothetical protein RX717_01350 [Intestinibacillus sp. NTUH-41-i26]SCJ38401.1 DNA polymerase III subunit beta [uncultured Butyricicoccus sp.]
MRFLANRSELLPIARRCSQTIGTYFVSKEHACVLMEADAASNTVMFTARSRTCTLQVRHACRVEESGRALLFAPVFQRMLDAFADEATSVATDGRQIEVRNAKAAFVFPLMDADKYPAVGTPAPAQLLDCSGFAEVSARVLFSAAQGKAEGKEQLKCVHLTVHDGKFSAASCDGFRMTVAREDAAQDEPIDLLIPADAMKVLLAVFRGVPHCRIGVDGGTALFLGPGMVFSVQRSPYQAVDLKPVLERFQTAYEAYVDGALFCAELHRAGVGGTAGARVILRTGKGMLQIGYISGDRQAVQGGTEFPADVRTPLPREGFCYTYNYLLQAAKLVNGKETALLLDGKGTLMLRTGSELHVLMPTRMPQEEVEKPKRKKKAA